MNLFRRDDVAGIPFRNWRERGWEWRKKTDVLKYTYVDREQLYALEF